MLHQSCFYPEGGGQPGDRGHLNGITVINTEKSTEGKILHLTTAEIKGTTVSAEIDWEHRYTYMCQHSGQHIISAALQRMGYETLSVHFGSSDTTIDINAPQISDQEIAQLEQRSNEIIRKNLRIHAYTTMHPEKENLRRNSQRIGLIRVVEIEGWDRVGCGGVHVLRTGEVLLIKIINQERIHHHTRLHFSIAERALEDYQIRHRVTQKLTTQLSTPLTHLPDAVQTLHTKLQTQQKELRTAWKYSAWLLFSQLPRPCAQIYQMELFPHLVTLMVQEQNSRCLVSSDEHSLRWAFITEKGLSPLQLTQLLLPIKGKGGGVFPLYQGKGYHRPGISEFFKEFQRKCISS